MPAQHTAAIQQLTQRSNEESTNESNPLDDYVLGIITIIWLPGREADSDADAHGGERKHRNDGIAAEDAASSERIILLLLNVLLLVFLGGCHGGRHCFRGQQRIFLLFQGV